MTILRQPSPLVTQLQVNSDLARGLRPIIYKKPVQSAASECMFAVSGAPVKFMEKTSRKTTCQSNTVIRSSRQNTKYQSLTLKYAIAYSELTFVNKESKLTDPSPSPSTRTELGKKARHAKFSLKCKKLLTTDPTNARPLK